MELHCAMSKNSSKNACLQAFNDKNSIENERWKHDLTQIDVAPNKEGNTTVFFFDPSNSMSGHFIPFYVQQHKVVLEHGQETSQGNPPDGYFNPQSHYYNLLLSLFETDQLPQFKAIHQSGEWSQNHGKGNEWDVEEEEVCQFSINEEEEDIIEGGDEDNQQFNEELNSDDAKVASDAVHILSRIQTEFEYASSNMTFTDEFNLCFELEVMLREARAPLYLYDKIMKWRPTTLFHISISTKVMFNFACSCDGLLITLRYM